MTKSPALIIHGGCGSFDLDNPIEKQSFEMRQKGLARAVEPAWKMLKDGDSATNVVEFAINLLEDDPWSLY